MKKTEYWVSQTRKYCDFCKCVIADNKPSIQFHESGKKHKENVRLRLSEMQKKATKAASSAATIEKQMKKMESAAMKAYIKDMEANPDFTSQMIKDTLEAKKTSETSAESTGGKRPSDDPQEQPHAKKKCSEKKWMEAKTAENYTYYWHIETAESVWEAPKEGYLSIEEQDGQKQPAQPAPKPKRKKEPKEKSVLQINREIYGSGASTNKIKEEPNEHVAFSGQEMGPSPRAQPYGSWIAVVKQEAEIPDLQLPEVKSDFPPVMPMTPEDRPKVFKERKAPVAISQGQSEVSFKKRKFGGARNARQRGNDD